MLTAITRLPLRIRLLVVVLGCWLLAWAFGLRGVDGSGAYRYATAALLTVGLFASTLGIDLASAREHRRLILSAVTVGVLAKAAIIGAVLYLATHDPLFLVLAVAVAQIDPLSVSTLMGDGRMSPRVKTILASWASFDDPITVILVVYASAIATGSFGLNPATGGPEAGGNPLLVYGLDLGLNLAFAGLAYLAWRALRRRPGPLAVALGLLAALAVWQFLMLGVAIAGLFVRPRWLEPIVGRVTDWALLISGALLGLLLVNGVNLGAGILLGVVAFVAQIPVALLLTRGLSRTERVHLALAQQNGITAIILALRLETLYSGVVAVIAPAIVATNVTYFLANWLADRTRRTPTS